MLLFLWFYSFLSAVIAFWSTLRRKITAQCWNALKLSYNISCHSWRHDTLMLELKRDILSRKYKIYTTIRLQNCTLVRNLLNARAIFFMQIPWKKILKLQNCKFWAIRMNALQKNICTNLKQNLILQNCNFIGNL